MHADQEAIALEASSPFADTVARPIDIPRARQREDYEDEGVDPFAATMSAVAAPLTDARGAARNELLAELHDEAFNEVLYNVAGELAQRGEERAGSNFEFEGTVASLGQQAYLNELATATENAIERLEEHFAEQPMAAASEGELEQLFESMPLATPGMTPVQEQFFGKIVKAVKGVVKAGAKLVKKGIKAVSKVLPIAVILRKLKKLIRPLLTRVLKFAIGKLPKKLQPHARTLAKKLLGVDAEASAGTETETRAGVDDVQREWNEHVAAVAQAPSEGEADVVTEQYGADDAEAADAAEAGPDLSAARERFVAELQMLAPGQDPTPAVEHFLPAALIALQPAIKIAITLIGRDKVIGFLAKPLAGMVKKYVPEAVSVPLASKIIDLGLSALGFETAEQPTSDLTYEALASTIEESVRGMDISGLVAEANEESLATARRSMMNAFERSAADHFPNAAIKSGLHTTTCDGVWVLMPRSGREHSYKKFSRVFDLALDAAKVRHVRTFRHLPLANFLRDKFGLDLQAPVKARVHVYEAIKGTWLSKISMLERVPGLGSAGQSAWNQIHPLSVVAAASLLGEPGLGRNFTSEFTASRHRIAVGQRFYYLELGRAPLRRPDPGAGGGSERGGNDRGTSSGQPARSGDVQAVINFQRAEIRLNCFFSEADAVGIASKLRSNDYLGATKSVETAIRDVLSGILIKNVGSKVKIVHEASPEQYMDQWLGYAVRAVGGAVAGAAAGVAKDVLASMLKKLADLLTDAAVKAVQNYFKARAAEFIAAQADAKDGVTVRVTFNNVPGMAALSALVQAVKGNLTAGNLADLVLPSLPIPDVQIKPDKLFD